MKRRTTKELIESETWTCSKCSKSKLKTKFRRHRSTPTGFKQPCQACNSKLNTIWKKSGSPKAKASVIKDRKYAKENYQRLRKEVLQEYGGKCACCGEPEPMFLGIDHINNDGAAHRRELKTTLYRYLKDNNYPKDRFQILCHNCNIAKGLYKECPHKTKRLKIPLNLQAFT
jgi:hypothetical protein